MNEATDAAPEPESRKKLRGWKKFGVLGPAIIVGGLQFGPGNTVSAATAGAEQGVGIIWLIVVSSLLMLAYTDMAVRIGMASPNTSIASIKEVFGRPVGIILGVAAFIIACLFMTGSLVGASLGLTSLFGFDVKTWTVGCAVLLIVLMAAKNAYMAMEKVMIGAVALMVAVFGVTAIIVEPDWVDVAQGLVPGPVPGDNLAVFALLGTNLSIAAAFYATYTIREKGTKVQDYRSSTLIDTLPGVLLPGLMTILIIVVGATVLQGRTLESADDIADGLVPTVGGAAPYIFAIGIFAAGFSSVAGNAAAGGTEFADAIGQGKSLNAKTVRFFSLAVLAIGVLAILIFGGAPVQLILVANALTLFAFPFLGIALLYLANNKERMGTLRNRWWQNIAAVLALAFIVVSAVILARDMFF